MNKFLYFICYFQIKNSSIKIGDRVLLTIDESDSKLVKIANLAGYVENFNEKQIKGFSITSIK